MKIAITIVLILACVSLSCTTLLAQKEESQQKEIDYTQILKQRYKEVETSERLVKSWSAGMLNDYNLVLDHLEIKYEQTDIAETTDEKTLICGTLLIIAYGKTLDGNKKRVASSRAVCHLFNKEKLEKVTVINKQSNKVLNGWDDLTII